MPLPTLKNLIAVSRRNTPHLSKQQHEENARTLQRLNEKVLRHFHNRSAAPLSDPARETAVWRECEKRLIRQEIQKLAKQQQRRWRKRKDEYLPRTLLKEQFEEKVLVTFEIALMSSQKMSESEKALINLMECNWMTGSKAIATGDEPDTPPDEEPSDLLKYYRFLTERRPIAALLDCGTEDTRRRGNTSYMLAGTPHTCEQWDFPTRPGLLHTERSSETSTEDQSHAEHLEQERENLIKYIEDSNEKYLYQQWSAGEPAKELLGAVSDPGDIVRDNLWDRLHSNRFIMNRFRFRTLKDHDIRRSPLCQVEFIDNKRTPSQVEAKAMFRDFEKQAFRSKVLREHRAQLDADYEAYLAAERRLQQRVICDVEE